MSTRYVWEKKGRAYTEQTKAVTIIDGRRITSSSDVVGYIASDIIPRYDSNKNLIGWHPGSVARLYGNQFQVAYSPNFGQKGYFIAEHDENNNDEIVTTYGEASDTTGLTYWYGTHNYESGSTGGINRGAATLHSTPQVTADMDKTKIRFLEHSLSLSGEATLGKVSSADRSTYPSGDSSSGDSWYVYLGADTIDPISISYPTTGIKAGDNITVSVSPRYPVYGGTISYLYQYNINGSGWYDIQTTTDTSVQFSIPTYATTIQFRARAQDDWGFVSADYVAGPIVNLQTGTVEPAPGEGGSGDAWIGVENVARQATAMWVGVDGAARKVKAAWIGVNGVARKVF